MKKWLNKFMIGRYGVLDSLSKLIFSAGIFMTILSMIFNSTIISLISLVLPILFIYRTFSKNVNKRYAENVRFLRFINPIKNKIRNKFNKIRGLKDYKYYECVNCGQSLRVPRGKGKITITCPKCYTKMTKNS